ncbi:hypothetical protein S245_064649, partial [Arachis hypogaea]
SIKEKPRGIGMSSTSTPRTRVQGYLVCAIILVAKEVLLVEAQTQNVLFQGIFTHHVHSYHALQ